MKLFALICIGYSKALRLHHEGYFLSELDEKDKQELNNTKMGAACRLQRKERALWRQAVREAGLNPKNISEFGRCAVKYPQSIVETVLAMKKNNLRSHKYTFMGRIHGNQHFSHEENGTKVNNEEEARQWAIDFAMTHFADPDIFVNTSPSGWKTLGSFDYSKELGNRHNHEIEAGIDKTYWKNMITSNFTLCPGGDTKWSMRAYEAALSGSICVIKSFNDDWRPETSMAEGDQQLQKVFNLLKFVTVDHPHVYSESIANDNLKTFIRYLTFVEGDHTPF